MPDVWSNTTPPEFASLTKKQKGLVRKLAWESLKREVRFVVIIPGVFGCLGTLISFFPGVIVGRLIGRHHHPTLCFVTCLVMGAGIGAWVGWMWLERECQTRFKDVIKENEDRISRIV